MQNRKQEGREYQEDVCKRTKIFWYEYVWKRWKIISWSMALIHSYSEATIDLFLLWCITSHTKKLQTDDETALWNSPFRCQCNKYYSWLLLTVSYVIFAMLTGSNCTLIFWWCDSHMQKVGLIYHCWINTGPKSLRDVIAYQVIWMEKGLRQSVLLSPSSRDLVYSFSNFVIVFFNHIELKVNEIILF